MKFDSNRAWKEASEAIAANRDVLFAIAGVFILIPTLAFSLLFPQPQPAAGADPDAIMAQMQAFYLSALPWLLPVAVVQGAGTMALLTLFTDRSRPTVGEAIRRGFASILPYLLAQLLLGIGVGVIGGVLLAVAALTGVNALVAVVLIAIGIGAIYAAVKTSLSSAVIAVEGERNPVSALRRSWQLTRGNSGRIAVFYLLVAIAFVVVMMVVMALVGMLLALLLDGETATAVSTVFSSFISTAMTVYFVGIIAAVHRQLAGPAADHVASTFE